MKVNWRRWVMGRFYYYIVFMAILCFFAEDPFRNFTMGIVVFILYEVIEISKNLNKNKYP